MADFHVELSLPGSRGDRSVRTGPAKIAWTMAAVTGGSFVVCVMRGQGNDVLPALRDAAALDNLRA